MSGASYRMIAYLIMAFVGLPCAAVEANGAEPQNILLLYSFGTDFAPWSETSTVFRAEMNKRLNEPIEIYEASIFERFDSPQEQAEARLAGYLRDLFSTRKLKLVASFGAPAAHFIQRHRLDLFAGVPAIIG